MLHSIGLVAGAMALVLGTAATGAAQGAGAAGAVVLQMHAGARAAGLSGAYTGVSDDADVLFYNPAGLGGLDAAAGVSYQRHVEDIGLATGVAALRVGRFVFAAGAVYLNQGSIDVIEPDPDFGGQTGRPTGATVHAYEMAARLAGSTSLMDERLRIGGAVGLVQTSVAEASRRAPLVDAGAQYESGPVTLGAALRNLGPRLSGGGVADADLPAEARFGASGAVELQPGIGALLTADLVHRVREAGTGIVAGVEAGILPAAGEDRFGAVLRAGFDGAQGSASLGSVRLGAGLTWGFLALDYAFQNFQHFGAVHRIGVRWSRPDGG